MNERFEKLAKEYGFQIKDCFALINNVWLKRPDILSVRYHGHHIMTIPFRIYSQPNETMTLEGNPQPMYFDLEYKLKNWNILIKRTPHIQNLEKKKIEVENLEKLYG
jgi:hypothetical protein